jgi:vacuolar-type H+-ATPase subunit I/STV1
MCVILELPRRPLGYRKDQEMRGTGRVAFAAVLLIMVGVLNIVYGFGALDDANYFAGDTRFVLENLNTLGWVLILLGVVQLTAGFSLFSGHTYGRMIGIVAGSLGAIGALLSIGGANPWWSLCVFALCVYIVHGIVVFGEDEAVASAS